MEVRCVTAAEGEFFSFIPCKRVPLSAHLSDSSSSLIYFAARVWSHSRFTV
jgi:hypothetical protein